MSRPAFSSARRALLGLPVVLGLFACSATDNANPMSPFVPASAAGGAPAPIRTQLTVCTFGANADFALINGGSNTSFSLTDFNCSLVLTNTVGRVNPLVIQTASDASTLDSVVVDGIIGAVSNATGKTRHVVLTNVDSAVAAVGLEWGGVISYYSH